MITALDIPESGNWTALSAAHRDFISLSNTPSGEVNVHGLEGVWRLNFGFFPLYLAPSPVKADGIRLLN